MVLHTPALCGKKISECAKYNVFWMILVCRMPVDYSFRQTPYALCSARVAFVSYKNFLHVHERIAYVIGVCDILLSLSAVREFLFHFHTFTFKQLVQLQILIVFVGRFPAL